MVNIELMSDNLTLLIKEIVGIQKVVRYLSYDVKSPLALSLPDIALPANNLIQNKIHPYPFDPLTQTQDSTEVRVYYPEGEFDASGAIANTFVYFDIVVAKNLWLINDGKSAIRPYMIMKELVDHFTKKSIGTLGRVEITNFVHLHINEKFDCLRLEANVVLFGEGE